jgi:anti-sigma regulatory factor (Ser/Thr protein kinase)
VTRRGSDAWAEAALFDREFDASALPLLREQVMAYATAAGLPERRVIDVTLAVHELAANAVRHGPGWGRLQMRAPDGLLHCQVSDTGPGDVPWPFQHGHGLWLVRQFADQMTVSQSPDGAEVTVVFTADQGTFPADFHYAIR